MNRVIKFRAWCKKDKKFIDTENSYLDFDGIMYTYYSGFGKWNPEEIVLMQFTALKDLNNVDIYEGDIIKATYEGFEEPEIHIGHVIYDNLFGYMLDFGSKSTPFSDFDVEEFEIIGNIFENPELLEEDKTND